MIKFKVSTENLEGNTSTVVIEPLEQGYGHTLGNSLRRCLLGSLQGAAITSVKISGVSHQFSTIPGVIEDVIQIILNLKLIRLRIDGDKPVRMTLQKAGKGDVTAADIDTLGQAEIINKDQHIATISDPKIKLHMEFTAENGVGYSGADERNITEIGVLPVDAIFTPIISVNYTVDQTRVGRRTDFDKLSLVITTDGTIGGQEAVEKSAQILVNYFKQIVEPTGEEVVEETPKISKASEELLKASIEELDLPVRITNALKAIDIDTIGTLLDVQPAHLMKAKNLGAKSLNMIQEKLNERGLSLGEA